jgi:hypothetical protein
MAMTTPIRSTRTTLIRVLAALALAAAPLAAPAQTAAPAAPGLDSKPDCGPKPEHPGKLGSDYQRRAWQKAANTYVECLKKYVTAKNDLAQQYMKSANAAIDEYNATIKEFEAQSKGE